LTIDSKGNGSFYNKSGVQVADITSGAVPQNSENARRFLAALAQSTGESASTAPGAAHAPERTPATTAAPAATTPAPAGEVKTFPMEDPAPGKEPPR
ncbi:MAG: hypothetical protein ABIP38_05480, partial [Steroidobacteraceae bacterium]